MELGRQPSAEARDCVVHRRRRRDVAWACSCVGGRRQMHLEQRLMLLRRQLTHLRLRCAHTWRRCTHTWQRFAHTWRASALPRHGSALTRRCPYPAMALRSLTGTRPSLVRLGGRLRALRSARVAAATASREETSARITSLSSCSTTVHFSAAAIRLRGAAVALCVTSFDSCGTKSSLLGTTLRLQVTSSRAIRFGTRVLRSTGR